MDLIPAFVEFLEFVKAPPEGNRDRLLLTRLDSIVSLVDWKSISDWDGDNDSEPPDSIYLSRNQIEANFPEYGFYNIPDHIQEADSIVLPK